MKESSITFRCLQNIGFSLIVFWFIFLVSFVVSLSFACFDDSWAMVGWIVPMLALVLMGVFWAFSIAFMLLIRTKEKKYIQQYITLGLFEKTEKYLFKKWVRNLSVFVFWFTTILFALAVWVWFFVVIFFVVCFVFDFFKHKLNNNSN